MPPARKVSKSVRYARKLRRRFGKLRRWDSLFRFPKKQGMLKLIRKCPEVLLTNNALAGTYSINDPTGNMLASSGTGVATGFLNTYDIPFSMKFSLDQIINSSEVTSIADKYRLMKTVVRVYFNSNQVSVSNPTSLPQFTYITDSDDASIPTTAQVREKMGSKIKYFNNKNYMSITLYPRPTAEVYGTGVLTAYSPGFKGWLDCNSPSVQHYGLKGVFQNVVLPSTANVTGFKWDVTHYIIAKDLQ